MPCELSLCLSLTNTKQEHCFVVLCMTVLGVCCLPFHGLWLIWFWVYVLIDTMFRSNIRYTLESFLWNCLKIGLLLEIGILCKIQFLLEKSINLIASDFSTSEIRLTHSWTYWLSPKLFNQGGVWDCLLFSALAQAVLCYPNYLQILVKQI